MGVFPEKMKIARVTLIFKGGEVSDLGNYPPISVYVAFLKFLKKLCIIIFTNIYVTIIYFIRNNLDFKKIVQLTDHAIIQLVDQISNSFEKNHFTLGVFFFI